MLGKEVPFISVRIKSDPVWKVFFLCENAREIRLQSDRKLCILKEKHTFLHKI